MITRTKHTGKAKSIPAGMAIAVSVSMMVTLGAALAIAYSLDFGKITWEQAGYWIMGMLFASSYIGAKCAFWVIKRQRIMISMMVGLIYWGMLLCITALFFGGNFGAVLETAGIICAGCTSSALIFLPNRKVIGRKQGRGYC